MPKPQDSKDSTKMSEDFREIIQSLDTKSLTVIVDEPKKKFKELPNINWWDLFNAVAVPLVLLFIPFVFEYINNNNNKEIAAKQREQDLQIARDNQEVQYLDSYIESATTLLIQANSEEEKFEDSSAISLLKAETFAVLRVLSGKRKGIIIRLLQEQGILVRESSTTAPFKYVSKFLSGADLRKSDLSSASLRHVDLSNSELELANLANADFYNADLTYAKLLNADLFRAKFSKADLTKADLTGANLVDADLHTATGYDTATFTGAMYAEDKTDVDVCFSYIPDDQKRKILESIVLIDDDFPHSKEPENGWTIRDFIKESDSYSSVEDVVRAIDELDGVKTQYKEDNGKSINEAEHSILECSTTFPDGFIPAKENLRIDTPLSLEEFGGKRRRYSDKFGSGRENYMK